MIGNLYGGLGCLNPTKELVRLVYFFFARRQQAVNNSDLGLMHADGGLGWAHGK